MQLFRSIASLIAGKEFALMTKTGEYWTLIQDSSLPSTINLTRDICLALKFKVVIPCLAAPTPPDPNCISFMSVDKPGWIIRHYLFDVWLEFQVKPRKPGTLHQDASFHIRCEKFFSGFFALEAFNYPNYFAEKDNNSTRGIYMRSEATPNSPGINYEESSFTFIEF